MGSGVAKSIIIALAIAAIGVIVWLLVAGNSGQGISSSANDLQQNGNLNSNEEE